MQKLPFVLVEKMNSSCADILLFAAFKWQVSHMATVCPLFRSARATPHHLRRQKTGRKDETTS